MGFTVLGPKSVEEVAGLGPVPGIFNGLLANLIVFEVGMDMFAGRRLDAFKGPLKHSGLAVLHGHDTYTSPKSKKEFNVYAFEFSKQSILDFSVRNNSFGPTVSLLRQIHDTVCYVHSIGYVIENLDSPTTYLFSQVDGHVSVKLFPWACHEIEPGCVAAHRKASNLRDLAQFFCLFFFPPRTEDGLGYDYILNGPPDGWIEKVLGYDYELNEPPIRFVPFKYGKILYTAELIYYIEKLASYLLMESDPSGSRNYTVFWSWEKRLLFLQIAWEWIKTLPADHGVIEKINAMIDFKSRVGQKWMKLPSGFLKDLEDQTAPRRLSSPVSRRGHHADRSAIPDSRKGHHTDRSASPDGRKGHRSGRLPSHDSRRGHHTDRAASPDSKKGHRTGESAIPDSKKGYRTGGSSIPDSKKGHRTSRSASPDSKKGYRTGGSSIPDSKKGHRTSRSASPDSRKGHRTGRSANPDSTKSHRTSGSAIPDSKKGHRTGGSAIPDSKKGHRTSRSASLDSRKAHRTDRSAIPDSRNGHCTGRSSSPVSRRGHHTGTSASPDSRKGYRTGRSASPDSRKGYRTGRSASPDSRKVHRTGISTSPCSRRGHHSGRLSSPGRSRRGHCSSPGMSRRDHHTSGLLSHCSRRDHHTSGLSSHGSRRGHHTSGFSSHGSRRGHHTSGLSIHGNRKSHRTGKFSSHGSWRGLRMGRSLATSRNGRTLALAARRRPFKIFVPESYSAADFLRKVRNLIVHGVFTGQVHGFDVYSRYDADIRRGVNLFLCAEIPRFLMNVYEVLSEAWGAGLCNKSLESFLNLEYDPDSIQ